MIDVKKMIEKYYINHFRVYPRCEGCGSEIRESDAAEVEYVKTKRKTELFMHKACVNKMWKK